MNVARLVVATAAVSALSLAAEVEGPGGPAQRGAVFFSVRSVPTVGGLKVAEVICRGTEVVLRLRTDKEEDVATRAQRVARKLNAAFLAGVTPRDLEARSRDAALLAHGKAVVTVDGDTARLSRSSPNGLAKQWLARLQALAAAPYLALDPADKLLVPLGEERQIKVGGTVQGPLSLDDYAPDLVQLKASENKGAISVKGLARGETLIAVQRGQARALVAVSVRPWAARVQPEVTAMVSGTPARELLELAVANAVLAGTDPQPEAHVTLASLPAAEPAEPRRLLVEASGEGLLTVRQPVSVTVEHRPAPREEVEALLVSNDPENIRGEQSLLFSPLRAGEPVRLLYHHKNDSGGKLYLYLAVLNLGQRSARLHVISEASGPSTDELFVGHSAARRYWGDARAGRGCFLSVPAGRIAYLLARGFAPGQIISGLARLQLLEGNSIFAEVMATPRSGLEENLLAQVTASWEELPPVTPHIYAPLKELRVEHTAGDRWGFLDLGRHATASEAGARLRGDYGVHYRVEAVVRNPSGHPVVAELAVRGSAGAARGTFCVDGELIETGLLTGASEEVLARSRVPPRATRRFGIETMPESGSNYPVTLVVRSR